MTVGFQWRDDISQPNWQTVFRQRNRLMNQTGHHLADRCQPFRLQHPRDCSLQGQFGFSLFGQLPQPRAQCVGIDRLDEVVGGSVAECGDGSGQLARWIRSGESA